MTTKAFFLRHAKKFAWRGLPVRAVRTPSSRWADSEFARRELFGAPKALEREKQIKKGNIGANLLSLRGKALPLHEN